MDKNFRATFDHCPSCGSKSRFLEQLAQELKDRGLARPEWKFFWDIRDGVVVDQQKSHSIPIGSTLPGYHIGTDICMDCGTIYAVELVRLEGKTGLSPVPKGGKLPPMVPPFNNPMAS